MVILKIRLLIGIAAGRHAKFNIRIPLCKFFCCNTIIVACGKNNVTACINQSLKVLPFRPLSHIVHRHYLHPVLIQCFKFLLRSNEITCISCTCITYIDKSYLHLAVGIPPENTCEHKYQCDRHSTCKKSYNICLFHVLSPCTPFCLFSYRLWMSIFPSAISRSIISTSSGSNCVPLPFSSSLST